MLTSDIVRQVFLRLLNMAWLTTVVAPVFVILCLAAIPFHVYARFADKAKRRSIAWLIVRPLVTAECGVTKATLNRVLLHTCEIQYAEARQLPPYVRVGRMQFRLELTQHLARRDRKSFMFGFMTGWSGDTYYNIPLMVGTVDGYWNFVGVRRDILPRAKNGRYSLFAQRHEFQHEIQRCFDNANDSQIERRRERELDANAAAFDYLTVMDKNMAWNRGCWALRRSVERFLESKSRTAGLVAFLCCVAFTVYWQAPLDLENVQTALHAFVAVVITFLALR